MKALKKYIFMFVMLFLCPIGVLAQDIDYDKAIEMVKEVMRSYYIRGENLQYNYAKAQYGNPSSLSQFGRPNTVVRQNDAMSPEEATAQDNNYIVCAAFTYAVYNETFGISCDGTMMNDDITMTEAMLTTDVHTGVFKDNFFPKYNYHIIMAGQNEYLKIKHKINTVPEGKVLLWYQSNETADDTTEEIRKRKEVKYVYGDNDASSPFGDFETLVSHVQPGDLFVYTGHALIAYDSVDRDGDGVKDDVLILNSTGGGEIKTPIESTSRIFYNMFPSSTGNNNIIDVSKEGSIKYLWLSEIPEFVYTTSGGKRILSCDYEKKEAGNGKESDECAVVRPFYKDETTGKAVFNFQKSSTTNNANKSSLRVEYPGLYIEKSVNKGDNDSIYVGDELTYTIKIENKSGTVKDKSGNPINENYKDFYITDQVRLYNWFVDGSNEKKQYLDQSRTLEKVKYKDGSADHSGSYNPLDGTVTWNVSSLAAGESIELSYTVSVIDDVGLVGTSVESSGTFKKSLSGNVAIHTGYVDNTIIPKVTKKKKSYSDCYDEYINGSDNGLELIDKIYQCATGYNFQFDAINFGEMFELAKKSATATKFTKSNAQINFKSGLNSTQSKFKSMILNNYYSGLAIENSDQFLPRWTSTSSPSRAKTINSSDFKEGDVLVYKGMADDLYTNESNDLYAYIYVTVDDDGKTKEGFYGLNYNGQTKGRNAFTYNYYEGVDYVADTEANDKTCPSGMTETACKYWGNLYRGFSSLDPSSGIRPTILKFANYQTLYGKPYYVILRPEQVIEEVAGVEFTPPSTTSYIQNHDELNLTDAELKVLYNNGKIENVDFDDENVEVTGFNNSTIGTKIVTVTYTDSAKTVYTKTFEVEVVSKQISKVEFKNEPLKTRYVQNSEELDLDGGYLKVTYTDESTEEISMTNSAVVASGFDNTTLGSKEITITYQGHSVSFDVSIIAKEVTKIEVKTAPSKTNYVQNSENLDLTGGVLKITYNDKKTDDISMTNSDVTVSGFSNSTLGSKTITVTYREMTTTFNVEVISKQQTKIEVKTKPTKTTYIKDSEILNLTGGIITVTYNDGSTTDVPMLSDGVAASGFSNSSLGTKTITITYNGHETTFNVSIVSKLVTKIEVKTMPLKTDYVVNSENIDLSGGVITATYNDGSTSEVPMTSDDVEASGFNNSSVGRTTITLKYQDKTTTFNVEIIAKQVTKIEVKTNPIKTTYVQKSEDLDLTDGVLKVIYNDGTTSEIGMTNSDVVASGFSNSSVGVKTVTLTYQEKTTTFNVEVISKQVTDMKIAKKPSKTTYVQNSEILDLTGGTLKVTYNDNKTDEINMTNTSLTVTGFDNKELGKKTIKIEYLGHEVSFEVEIISKQIVKVEMTQLPSQLQFEKNSDNIDLSGGVITVTYNDGTTSTVSMTQKDVELVQFDRGTLGEKTITLNYLGREIKLDIEIVEAVENPETNGVASVLLVIFITFAISFFIYTKLRNNKVHV